MKATLTLPGSRVPRSWMSDLPGGYHLRMDRQQTYLIYGAEDIIATWPKSFATTLRGDVQEALQKELWAAIGRHKARRGGMS